MFGFLRSKVPGGGGRPWARQFALFLSVGGLGCLAVVVYIFVRIAFLFCLKLAVGLGGCRVVWCPNLGGGRSVGLFKEGPSPANSPQMVVGRVAFFRNSYAKFVFSTNYDSCLNFHCFWARALLLAAVVAGAAGFLVGVSQWRRPPQALRVGQAARAGGGQRTPAPARRSNWGNFIE